MAASGSFSKVFSTGYTLLVEWTESNVDAPNNQSDITVTAKLKASGSYHISSSASKSISLTINGTKYSGTCTVGISGGETKTLMTKTVADITHSTDGSKTISISCSLDIQVTLSGSYVSNVTTSGSATLTKIARSNTLSASNGTLGTAQTLTVTKADSSFTHTITYTCGSASGTICTKSSAASVSWTPPLSLASQAPSGTAVSVALKIQTYSGSTALGNASKTITCSIPASVKPSISIAVSDNNGYASTYGAYIQGLSCVKVTATVTMQYSATASGYDVTIDGKKYTAGTSAEVVSDALKSTGSLTITASVTDSRGRTASTTQSITVLAYSPPSITAFTAKRCDSSGNLSATGTYLKVVFSAAITDFGSAAAKANTASYVLKYKKTSASAFTSTTLSSYSGKFSVSNGTYKFSADKAAAYDIILTATDAFRSFAYAGKGPAAMTLFSFLKGGMGIAFGKVADTEGFDINLPAIFRGKLAFHSDAATSMLDYCHPIGTIYETVDENFDPAATWGGTWERIKDKFLLSAGDTYTAGSTGGEATHKLTTSEMPSHSHRSYVYNSSGTTSWTPTYGSYALTVGSVNNSSPVKTWGATIALDNTGGSSAHNNMPPYLAVYVWKRTA